VEEVQEVVRKSNRKTKTIQKKNMFSTENSDDDKDDPEWRAAVGLVSEADGESEPITKKGTDRSLRARGRQKELPESSVSLRHPRLRRRKMSPCEFRAHNFDDKKETAESIEPKDMQTSEAIQVNCSNDEEPCSSPQSVVKHNGSNSPPSKKQRRSSLSANKPQSTYDRVKELYNAALQEYSASGSSSTPRFHGTFFDTKIRRKTYFECICGGYNDEQRKVLACTVCESSQHVYCVDWDAGLSAVMSRFTEATNALIVLHLRNRFLQRLL
jgi:hypothetical protein